MDAVVGIAFWTALGAVLAFPVTLSLIGLACWGAVSPSGRALRAHGARGRLLTWAPGALLLALWLWTAALAPPSAVERSWADHAALKAAAGWRYTGIWALLGAQATVGLVGPLVLRSGRAAAWAYNALGLWVAWLAAASAEVIILGLPMPLL